MEQRKGGSVVTACDGRSGGRGFESPRGRLETSNDNFHYPILPVSFGRDTKSRRSLLTDSDARGRNIGIYHTHGVQVQPVVDST